MFESLLSQYQIYFYAIPLLVILLYVIKIYINGPACKYKIDLSEKIVLITGANSGLGFYTAQELAKMKATIVMGCRNKVKSEKAMSELLKTIPYAKLDMMPLDVTDLNSVREFVTKFQQKYNRLDILINNAGTISPKKQQTKDGFDNIMGTNYFGPFLLTNLLLDVMKKTNSSRIINLTSFMYKFGYLDLQDLNCEKCVNHAKIYGGSKLALISFTKELGEKLENSNVKVCCVHPGVVRTAIVDDGIVDDIFTRTFLKLFPLVWWYISRSIPQGAQGILHCALMPHHELNNGKYYVDSKVKNPGNLKVLEDMQRKQLWEITKNLVKLNENNPSS